MTVPQARQAAEVHPVPQAPRHHRPQAVEVIVVKDVHPDQKVAA